MSGTARQLFAGSAKAFLGEFGINSLPEPGRDSLHQLYRAFTHLPYENVSKIIRSRGIGEPSTVKPSFRSPAEVLEGYLSSRLGGTCFSLTHCLYTLLRHCGFDCWRALGDMSHGPNIHCAVIVRLGGGKFLCDAGYLLPEPLELPVSGHKSLAGRVYRYTVEAEAGEPLSYSLYTESPAGGDKRWRYRIREHAVDGPVFEYHWERSFSAAMNHQLVLSRSTGEAHIYVHKHSVRHTTGLGRHNENIRNRLGASVQEMFGIDAELVERARELSERAKEKPAGGRR